MEPSPVKRKLAAILSADAVGYSRHMGDDEEQALRVLSAHRAVVDSIIQFHDGRIVSTAGDSVLAEFASPVEAVRAAVEIQEGLKKRNESLPEARCMLFRIGVNLGDVMVKDGDLLGDGVNIAARLQSIADPGGICVSGSIADQIEGKLDLRLKSMGEPKMKNIARPVRVYRVEAGGGKSTGSAGGAGSWRGQGRPWAIGIGLAAVAVAAVGMWMVYPQASPSAPALEAGTPVQSKLADEKKLADERASLAAAAAIEAERKANESLKRELEEAMAARRATAELLRREQEEASAAQRAASERRQREAEAAALAAARAAEADRAEAERLRREAATAMAAAQRAASELAKREAEQAAAQRAASELAKREAEQAAAQRAASDLAKREAEQAAAQRAASDLAKREAEQAAAQRAASDLAKREAEQAAAQRAASDLAKREAEQAAAQRAASDLAKREAEQAAAQRAASDAAKRDVAPASVAHEPERLAAMTPPPLTRFDGIWGGDYLCYGGLRNQLLFPRPLDLRVQNGNAVFEGGTPDMPGWDRAEGRIRDDGQVVMSGKGISNRRESFGVAYNISLAGRFEGDRFLANGKFGPRGDCTLDLKRAGR